MVIVSVTPELGIDEFYNYAGGLGVLEADKFYAAGEHGFEYLVLTFLYRGGYVDYDMQEHGPQPRPQLQPVQPESFMVTENLLTVRVRGEQVKILPWILSKGRAKAVFFEIVEPEWLKKVSYRVYIEESDEEKQYKYVALAKAASHYLSKRVGKERIDVVDLQEAYTSLIPLALGGGVRYRFITHTPGPWGHPVFDSEIIEEEFGYSPSGDKVMLTRLGMELAEKVFTVSRKHMEITKELFPDYSDKIDYVTNGVCLNRWQHPKLRKLLSRGKPEDISIEQLKAIRSDARKELLDFIHNYKPSLTLNDRPVIVWARRITRYKRPEFPLRLLEEPELAGGIVLVLAGKPHPHDNYGRRMLSEFIKAHKEYGNVVYIPSYDTRKAQVLLRGGDLLLNTPVSGWEACGTSYMKSMINGIPTLTSRDGGALEIINHGVNSWFFGVENRRFIPLDSPEALRIEEDDYRDFVRVFSNILSIWGTREYWEISREALISSIEYASVTRALREYYPWVFR